MRKLFSLLLAVALLVSTALSAEPIPAPQYVRYMNATDCSLRLIWYADTWHDGTSALFENQTITYADFQKNWLQMHPKDKADDVWLARNAKATPYKATTVPLKFAFNATNMTLPLRHGQLGVCNHHRVVFDFYVSGDALVFRVVPLPSTKGVTLK